MAAVAEILAGSLYPFIAQFIDAQSKVGHELAETVACVSRHWNESIQQVLMSQETYIDEDLSYEHVPFKKGFVAQVHFYYRGRMKPRAFPDDK